MVDGSEKFGLKQNFRGVRKIMLPIARETASGRCCEVEVCSGTRQTEV